MGKSKKQTRSPSPLSFEMYDKPASASALPRPILLPEVFGRAGNEDFSAYLKHFNDACGYSEEQKLLLLPTRLVGTSHELPETILLSDADISFHDAVEALRSRLEPPQQAQMHEAALRQRLKLAIASNRMSSRTLKINIILRIDLFFRITFQRGRSKVGRTKPRGRKSPSPLHHHDTDIDHQFHLRLP